MQDSVPASFSFLGYQRSIVIEEISSFLSRIYL